MSGGKPVIYVDLMSQPSRAVVIFCRVCGIEVEERSVKIAKKEQQSQQYLAVNPLGKLPCYEVLPLAIVDLHTNPKVLLEPWEGDFALPESAAILRYLATTRNKIRHWYPSDARQRARVDAALDWQHSTVRAGEARLVFHNVLIRNLGGPSDSDKLLGKVALDTLNQALKALDDVWLRDTDFVAGDHISIADLLICCELEQLVMLEAAAPDVPRQDALLMPFGRVRAWQGRVKAATEPHYSNVSKFLHMVAKRMAATVSPASRL